MRRGIYLIIIFIFFGGVFFTLDKTKDFLREKNNSILRDVEAAIPVERRLPINDGDTYGKLMEIANVGDIVATEIFSVAEDVYNLSSVRSGRELVLIYDPEGVVLNKLIYDIDTEDELVVSRGNDGSWRAVREPIPYEVKEKVSNGIIETTLYESALNKNIDERLIIELANVFQWSVDFAMDVRAGDSFKVVYEERYRDGKYVMPGKVLAANFVNDGIEYSAFYFEESEENKGYFDADGNSVQKMFLKAPVAYKYISSGFTTGRRYVQAFNISTGHRAIDYAATYGTPIRAVGDGTVTFAGWSGSYGYKTSIRHNGTYSTNYAHQSRLAVKRGQKVKQGEIIGYVGSTGLSTGPHVHYEMVKYGVKINPLREVLPPGKPIREENQNRFNGLVEKYKGVLAF